VITRIGLALLVLATLAGCAINQNVAPVKPSEITLLCIERNDDVMMAEFTPTLQRLIEARGVKTRLISGERPPECRYLARYTANWRWDLAMYLVYARIEVLDGLRQIGSAEYDATLGGLNLGKFGATEEKLRPLVDQLFAGV